MALRCVLSFRGSYSPLAIIVQGGSVRYREIGVQGQPGKSNTGADEDEAGESEMTMGARLKLQVKSLFRITYNTLHCFAKSRKQKPKLTHARFFVSVAPQAVAWAYCL